VAADTKRGAVWVTVDAKHNGVMVTLDSLREQLAVQGLHVVTAADKAVVDAALDYHRLDTSVNEERLRHYCRVAIAARREAAK
jgi:hypothetical protein